MKCLCWDNDNQERSDARTFEAADERQAAEEFAERHYDGEPFDFVDVHVERVMDAVAWVIRVDVTMTPVFAALAQLASETL